MGIMTYFPNRTQKSYWCLPQKLSTAALISDKWSKSDLYLFFFSVSLSLTEYIQKYATEEALKEQEEGAGDSSSESSMSDFSEDEAQDMEL